MRSIILICEKVDEVIKKVFELLGNRYQIGLETLIKGSNFIADCEIFLQCKCHEISLKHGGSYIDSFDLIKSKKHNHKAYQS